MARTPDAGVDLSDDDLDELIKDAEGSDDTGTPDPEPTPPAPAANTAATPSEADTPDTSRDSAEADEGTTIEAGQPAAPGDEPEEPAAPAPDEIPQDQQAPAVPGLDLAAGKPFQFKASGGEHTLTGAVELPDGSVVIPKDAQPEFRQRLASQVELSTQFRAAKRDYDRKLTTLKEQRTNKDIEADHIVGLFEQVLSMSPDERYDWAMQLDQDRPKIELEIQRKQLDAEREQLKREKAGPEPTPEERQEKAVATVMPHLNAVFQQIMAAPEAKALTKDEATAIYQKYASSPRRLLALVRAADEDDPSANLKKGDAYLDTEDIVEDFKIAIRLKQRTGSASPAEQRNKALNADTAPAGGKTGTTTAIPPAVRTGRVPQSTQRKKPEKFSKEAFMRGELDDD